MDEERLDYKPVGAEEEEETDKSLKLRVWEETKKFFIIAFPAIITRISSFGILVVTQSFMGHISEVELSAYALVQIFLVRFANGILLGMANALETLCGQAYGAKQYHMMGIYMQRSWIIVLVTATALIPVFVFATPILKLLGEDDQLSEAAGEISLWFIPILYYFVFNFTMQMFLQAQLKNAIIGWLSSISFVMHVFLSWLFVIKLNWGVSGAMGAMVISTWSITGGELVYVIGGWCPETWKGFSTSALSDLCPILRLSLSSGVMLCLELWYNAVLVLIAGYMSDATISVAAFSICLNIVAWVLMFFLGFLTAAWYYLNHWNFFVHFLVRVSNELGRGNAKAAKFSINVVMGTSLVIGLIFFAIALIFGHQISYAFTTSEAVAKAVSSLSILLAFSVLLNSIQPVLTGVAIGAGWQTAVAYVNIASYYMVGIPIGAVLAYVAHLEVTGIWIGMIIGILVQTLTLVYMTWKTDWNAQVVKANERLNRWLLPPTEE